MILQLINEQQANWNDSSLIDAIENILRAFSEKKHIVLASSFLFDNVKGNKKFSEKIRNTASVAKQYSREFNALIKNNYINSFIQIDLSQKDYFEEFEDNGKKVLKSGFAVFTDSSVTQNTSFIGESINDTAFYIHIGNFYIKNDSILNQCALSFSPTHGAGQQTADVYNNTLLQKRLCYCIVDSDKKHPSDRAPRGNTCKAFFKNANDFEETFFNKFGQVRILEIHEVESIIPIKILAKIYKEKKQKEPQLKTVKRLEKMIEKDSDIRKYFDHKKGLTKQQAEQLDKEYSEYYIPELNKLLIEDNKCFMHENEKQINCDDNCLFLAPMNDQILSESLKILDMNSIKKEDIDKFTLPYWEKIGKEIFSWCCCFNSSMKVS